MEGDNLFTTSNLDLQKNQWTHILFVFDGALAASKRVKVYKNGVQADGSVSGTLPTSLANGTSPITIGRELVSGQGNFSGLMDEVGMWGRVLSPEEIQQLFSRGP